MRQLFFYLQQLPVEICCGNMNCRMCSECSVDKVKSSVGGGARSPGAGLSRSVGTSLLDKLISNHVVTRRQISK